MNSKRHLMLKKENTMFEINHILKQLQLQRMWTQAKPSDNPAIRVFTNPHGINIEISENRSGNLTTFIKPIL